MSKTDDALEAAYRASLYVVHSGNIRIETRIDHACAALAAAMQRCSVQCAALVSACNPDSEPLPAERNLQRQRALEDELNDHDYAFLPAIGQSRDGHWQEPSVLILGISEDDACALGRRWGQRAIVVYDRTGRGRLRFVDKACA